jgi:hypothetical protein
MQLWTNIPPTACRSTKCRTGAPDLPNLTIVSLSCSCVTCLCLMPFPRSPCPIVSYASSAYLFFPPSLPLPPHPALPHLSLTVAGVRRASPTASLKSGNLRCATHPRPLHSPLQSTTLRSFLKIDFRSNKLHAPTPPSTAQRRPPTLAPETYAVAGAWKKTPTHSSLSVSAHTTLPHHISSPKSHLFPSLSGSVANFSRLMNKDPGQRHDFFQKKKKKLSFRRCRRSIIAP